MMDFFRVHKKNIFIGTVIIFVGGTFIGFGGYFFGPRAGSAVAEVNGVKIPHHRFNFMRNRAIEMLRQDNQDMSSEALSRVEQEVIQELIQDEVFWQEAKRFGISVSDAELAGDIRQFPAFQREGVFDQRLYFEFLSRVLRTTPAEFEEYRRRQISFLKLRYFISSSIVVSEEEAHRIFLKRTPHRAGEWENEKQQFIQSYKQEIVNAVFDEYLKQLNRTARIRVFHEAT